MKLQEVRESALALPRRSRVKLFKELAESLEKSSYKLSSVDTENLAEAESRIDAYERGELPTISLEDFLDYINRPKHASKARQARKERI